MNIKNRLRVDDSYLSENGIRKLKFTRAHYIADEGIPYDGYLDAVRCFFQKLKGFIVTFCSTQKLYSRRKNGGPQ